MDMGARKISFDANNYDIDSSLMHTADQQVLKVSVVSFGFAWCKS